MQLILSVSTSPEIKVNETMAYKFWALCFDRHVEPQLTYADDFKSETMGFEF